MGMGMIVGRIRGLCSLWSWKCKDIVCIANIAMDVQNSHCML